MKKVFLFLASCLVAFAAGAKTVSVSNSDLEWEENTSGEMEARIVIGDIGCSDVTLNFTGGNASKVPCYRVAIIDNGDPEYDYWHELSDWNDILEVNSSGNGSTTISLTACGQTNRVIAFFIQLDKNPNYFEQPDFQYEINPDGRTVTLTKARDGIEVANIPSSVTINGNTYTVTSIGGASFLGCTSLTSITIPSSVTSIGEVAFRECANLTQVIIPNSVTFIGAGAFYGCTSLTSVAIPKSVTSIEEGAFGDCTGLISISVSATSIGIYAFSDCENLTSVAITNNVTSIEEGAFQGCASLSSITIPNSVTSIGNFAFSGCTSLTSITIPGSVTSIGCGAFDCEILEVSPENTIYDSRNNCNAIIETVTNTLVAGCKNTVIPNSVTAIGFAAFACSETLTSITIPNSVTTIGDYAFYECINLSSITIPNSVILLGCGLFEECTNLSTVYSLSKNPPVVSLVNEGGYEVSFDINGATVYVPSESVSAYKSAPVWKTLNIQPIPAENVSLSKDEVVVNVEKTTADFSMPANESANSYTLTIRNNGVTFCTLTFNANGQLTDINFSTTKSYELKADVSAFKFTVTGLSEASDYRYSFKVLNASKSVLKEYVGSFTTKNADGTGGSTSGGGEGTLAIDNISPINTVAIVNNQILVNGEAPAFVYTIMGQKIANQNLKSGVYFVVVDGETVKVSVQ